MVDLHPKRRHYKTRRATLMPQSNNREPLRISVAIVFVLLALMFTPKGRHVGSDEDILSRILKERHEYLGQAKNISQNAQK